MKERPILFSAPMVQAILAGTKTQTRRVMVRQKQHDFTDYTLFGQKGHNNGEWKAIEHAPDWPDGKEDQCRCPYASHRGDRLWVRENGWERPERTPTMMRDGADTWAPYYFDADGISELEAADFKAWGFRRRPSIHMPRAHSRVLLEVTGLRIERLQSISEADAVAEGIGLNASAVGVRSTGNVTTPIAVSMYRQLWAAINGAASWNSNPWVWVVEFKRITP